MKKILYICSNSPFEHSYGAQQRTNLLCDALCEVGHVDVVCFTSDREPVTILKTNCSVKYFGELPIKNKSKLIRRLNKTINFLSSFNAYSLYEKDSEACKITRDLISENQYDFIVVRYLHNAFACGLYNNKQIIVDVDDLPEQSILSYADTIKKSNIKKYQYKFYARRARFHTNRFLKQIKHSFFPNEEQCRWQNSSYLPNIPYPIEKLQIVNDNTNKFIVLFVGLMSHTPNTIGVEYFINNVWPKVTTVLPSAVFKIVGKGVTSKQKEVWEEKNGVQVLGFVSDLKAEYNNSNVVVVPIYHGAGTNIKVLEAMYMHKASVISEFAVRGFGNDLINNENILIAKNDLDFTNKIVQLLTDPKFNMHIAENGYKTIEEKYSYKVFKDSVQKYIY